MRAPAAYGCHADEPAAANEPTVAAWLAPDDFNADPDRVSLFMRDVDLDLGRGQVGRMDQTNACGRYLAAESGVDVAIVGQDGDRAKERKTNFLAAISLVVVLRLDNELINQLARRTFFQH